MLKLFNKELDELDNEVASINKDCQDYREGSRKSSSRSSSFFEAIVPPRYWFPDYKSEEKVKECMFYILYVV